MYKISNDLKKIDAISETFSVIILMVIAISLFIALNMYIESDKGTSYTPSPIIVGHVEDDKIIIEHCQGPSLDLDAKCIVNIGGLSTEFTAEDYLNSDSKANDKWDIGERLVFELGDTTYLEVSLRVVDKKANSLLLNGVIQEGEVSNHSYIILTFEPTDIDVNSAKLRLGYNFRGKSGTVRFSYKSLGDSWINTDWVSKSGSGVYNETIFGLSSDKIYIYKAELNCESNTIEGEVIPILQDGLTSIDKIIP